MEINIISNTTFNWKTHRIVIMWENITIASVDICYENPTKREGKLMILLIQQYKVERQLVANVSV